MKLIINESQLNRLKNYLIKESSDNPCWDGYKQVGMKDKDGEQVPNCVPIDEDDSSINEISADKVMGAAKKMWHNKISGDDNLKNPRAEKLLTDYGNKLKGLKLGGGEVRRVEPYLEGNGNKSFFLYFYISTSGTLSFNNSDYNGLWYNYSTDRFMVGTQLGSDVRPIDEFKNTSLTKFDARQLYKVASHFNPNTRYANFNKEIHYNHEK